MRSFLFAIFLVLTSMGCSAGDSYTKYFTGNSLRIDFMLCGKYQSTQAFLVRLKQEPYWGGTQSHLVDSLGYGQYKVTVKDQQSGEIIFSQGFCTLFEEWQTTDEAKEVSRAFEQSVTVPFPHKTVEVSVFERRKGNVFEPVLQITVDPESRMIIKDLPVEHETRLIIGSREPHRAVDVVFLAEGYAKGEKEKFFADVRRFSDYLFSMAPYNELKEKFNIRAVAVVSEQSGTDDPRRNQWSNTAFHSSFNTFDTDRYLESMDVFRIRDAAALVPYDQIFVLVNSDKYGGGGVYNHFSLGTADNVKSLPVFIHEFGHGFGGLGDEYYASSVAYNDYIDQSVETWYPNLTTLVDFGSKWKHLVAPNVPVPTPDEKKFHKVTGVFEGGGYAAKGVFRPAYDCRMKTNEAEGFCEVCKASIRKVVYLLTE
jgi:hypothetical protein